MSTDDNPYASPGGYQPPIPPRVVSLMDTATDAEPPIEIAGQLTLEDFWHAIRMARHPVRRMTVLVAVLVVMLIAWAAVISSIWGKFTSFWVFGAAIGLLVLVGLLRRFAERRRVSQLWRQQKGSFEYFERTLTPDYVETRTALTLHRLQWPALAGFQVSQRLVLIYFPGPQRMFYILPRALFRDDDQWERCLQLLARRLARM